jgi:hypothetical protein
MLAISLHGLQAHKFHIKVSQLLANAAIAASASVASISKSLAQSNKSEN